MYTTQTHTHYAHNFISLLQLVEKGTKLVLEQMVTTVATIADTLDEHFLQYYERFMPLLKYLMGNAVQKENRLLRGKTIECISLIGLAVGKEKVKETFNNVWHFVNLSLTNAALTKYKFGLSNSVCTSIGYIK